ncbi:MAG TPA: hypothetical protein PKC69_09720 [Chitinophagaceae bacterium]|nr:hypothetical protein [Chitinophagaceae bacterium]
MKTRLLSAALLFTVCTATAQNLSFENIQKVELRNSGAIKEGTEVKGYYFFYTSDKINKNTNEYTLQITDNNLVKLKDIKMQDSKGVRLLESSFNGSDIVFLLYNEDTRTFDYQVYGADAKKKFNYSRILSKKDKRFLEQSYLMDDEDQTYKGLYPVEGKGFISNTPSREDNDYTFQIDYFSTEKRKQWTYVPTEGAKRFLGDYLGTYNGVVYLTVLKFGSKLSNKPDSYLVGLNLETGKQLFEKSTDGKYAFYPISLSVLNDGNAYLYGEYFKPNDNVFKDKSQGFGFVGVNEKGDWLSEKYSSWALDMGKHLPVSAKGKIDDFGYMFLHSMVQTADGSIFAIGEGYKKTASALGIMSTVLTRGSGVSMSKMKITDLAFIKFDKGFNIKEAKIYEKNNNNIELPSGSEFVSPALLGKAIKYYYGGFDYAYTQVNKEQTSFSVCYSDYERGKNYKGATFNSITYHEGKITTDKIQTKSDATRTIVLPGKQGQVLVLDYYKKKKQLDAHFEKLN